MDGTIGNDHIIGTMAAEEIIGLEGNDTIFSFGEDTIYGGIGDDEIYVETGSGWVFGGEGIDILVGQYVDTENAIRINLNQSNQWDGRNTDLISMTGFEALRFETGSGNDVFTGIGVSTTGYLPIGGATSPLNVPEIPDSFVTGDGSDKIYWVLWGDDWFDLGGGADYLDLYETVNPEFIDGAVEIVQLGETAVGSGYSVIGYSLGSIMGVEHFKWTSSGLGNDTINTGNSHDLIYGAAGNDTIVTRLGDDSIYGGSGADYLDVGRAPNGGQEMTGGGGADIFVFRRTNGDANVGALAHVLDFQDGVDKIKLFGVDEWSDISIQQGNGFVRVYLYAEGASGANWTTSYRVYAAGGEELLVANLTKADFIFA